MRILKLQIFLFVSMMLSAIGAFGQEWTRFRGPNGTGLSELERFPAEWDQDNFKWVVELPGKGHSSPVLWGDKVFLVSGDPESATRFVLCIDVRNGKILWQENFPSIPHKLHERNTYASSTPVVDSELVYIAWADPSRVSLMALDHDGRKIWDRDLGTWTSMHGFGTSPIRFNDLVILSNSQQGEGLDPNQQPGASRVMAFEAKTGKLRWETPRESAYACYSTPAIYYPKSGEPQLINASTSEGVFSLDPITGKELWRIGDAFTMRVVSSPVVMGDIVFGSTGSGGGGNYVSAFRMSETPKLLYSIRRSAPYVPSVVAENGLAFLFGDKGIVSCIQIDTGETLWQERISDGFSGSPIIAAGKVFCMSEDGTVWVLNAGREFQLLAKNELGKHTRSTPAVAKGKMYLRTESHLFAVGE
jgi:outer membrane protein assembly factor BamB